MERGIDNFLIIPFIDRAIGVRVDIPSEQTYFAAGLYGDGSVGSASEDEGWGATARYVYAPVQEDDETVHLALRAAVRAPNDGSTIQIDDETTNMSNFAVVDTGPITNVDQTTLWGAEATWAKGPFSIGGEFNQVGVGRDGTDVDFGSWHVETTYSLTGESRAAAYRTASCSIGRVSSAPRVAPRLPKPRRTSTCSRSGLS